MHPMITPTCYFPTTVLLVDASGECLPHLPVDTAWAYKFFSTPDDALACIHETRCELDALSTRCLAEYAHTAKPHSNLAALHAEVYNPGRFSEISVIVADSLDFFQQVDSAGSKKILLRDGQDQALVQEALHTGVIHRVISKQALGTLHEGIVALQREYFQSMSDIVVRMLSVSVPSCLQDEKFAGFFGQLCKQNDIMEFYLADDAGSFFMLDEDANISFLVVNGEADMAYVPGPALFDINRKQILTYHDYLHQAKTPAVGRG